MMELIAEIWKIMTRQGNPCLFQLITGLYCPGCGGTRAVKALLRGEFLTSLHYHPLVLYMAVVILGEILIYVYERKKKILPTWNNRFQKWVWLGIAVCGGNWIWKNIQLICYGIAL